MRRRDFVKAVLAASAAAPAAMSQQPAAVTPATPQMTPPAPAPRAAGPLPWTRGLREVKPLPMTPLVPDAVAETLTGFFTDHQFASLRKLCELMMPPMKGNPGALEAGAPEFLDFLIGASPGDRQQLYRGGLDRLESEAKQKFGASFAGVTAAQADELIRPWLRTWMSDHPPTEDFARFINLAHVDIRTATVNSQAWSDAAVRKGQSVPNVDLYWYPIDPETRQETRPETRRETQREARSGAGSRAAN